MAKHHWISTVSILAMPHINRTVLVYEGDQTAKEQDIIKYHENSRNDYGSSVESITKVNEAYDIWVVITVDNS